MKKPKTVMDIFRHLDKSNCRLCGEKTCLSFASEVFRGKKTMRECPKVGEKILKQLDSEYAVGGEFRSEREAYLIQLKAAVGSLDFTDAARRTGGRLLEDRLIFNVMGKAFGIDRNGQFFGDIHVNPWIAVPFLSHVLYGKGLEPAGNWVSFRELEEGRERYPLFQKRCEGAMKQVADAYPMFFDDLVHLFSGKAVSPQFQSDISVVLQPFPKLPVMICYWLPEEGMESSLNLYFDKSAEKNLDIGSIFSLGVGLARMIEKLSMRHAFHEEMSGKGPHI